MKYALIIGNNKYDDPKLAQLKTPAADSQALAKVLDDKTIGSFDAVTSLINQKETRVRRAISEFLTHKKPDDMVLLYFSGHGVLDDRGRLYLALKDTQVDLLKATSLPSSFLTDEMDSCRSKRQILILDCCHSGAFARGTKGEQKAVTEATFEGSGFGRVVLTASDSTQYALEGNQVLKQTEFSLFTHFLLDGLRTGQADINNDGQISLDEWYDYTYSRVISETPRQVPHKWSYNQQGDLVIARNPFVQKKVAALPHELVQALESSFVGIRESAVNELGNYLRSRDTDIVGLAVSALQRMQEDDSRRIASLASRLLAGFDEKHAPKEEALPVPEELIPESPPEMDTRSMVEEPALPTASLGTMAHSLPDLGLDTNGWLKWGGTVLLGIVFSYAFNKISLDMDLDLGVRAVLFGVTAAVTAFAQWFLLRHQLEIWWVPVNGFTGLGLGAVHVALYQHTYWGYKSLWMLLIVWSVLNTVISLVFVRSSQIAKNESIVPPASRTWPMLLFCGSLIVGSLASLVFVWSGKDDAKYLWVPYGILAIFAGIAFWRTRPARNFGWTTLALFLLIDGINTALLGIAPYDFPLYFFAFGGVLAWASGMFFAFHQETWRTLRLILLTGYLLAVGLANFVAYDTSVSSVVLIISALFGIPAAIAFLLQRQSLPAKQNSEA
ncbi:MAG TPA: caspase family protein [Anaerolineales bacterium]|nr:caspase family protein [Anaerolineales bacterium]